MQKLGENIQIRRLAKVDGSNTVGAYVHTNGKIGVLVDLAGSNAELASGLAMHVAPMNPHNKQADVPADFVAKEKEIELAKMSEKDKQKPAEILEKIISGKIAKIVNRSEPVRPELRAGFRQDRGSRAEGRRRRRSQLQRLVVGEGIERWSRTTPRKWRRRCRSDRPHHRDTENRRRRRVFMARAANQRRIG